MLLHGLLAILIPNLQFDKVKTPDVLQIELQKPEPPPIAQPEPPPPEPIKPKPTSTPKPIIKTLPTPIVSKDEPVTHTPPTEVIAVAPKADALPPPVPPVPIVAPEPPKPITPSQVDLDEARGKYGNTLWNSIGKYKQYPKIAQMRGWQGEATVELLLDGSGKLKSKKIIQTSGHEVLDKQALEMVERAAPYPTPPEALRGSNFTIIVPIPFKLE